MIRGMVCRNRNALAARCVMVSLAGFPSGGPTALTAQTATEFSLANQSTPQLEIREYDFQNCHGCPRTALVRAGNRLPLP